MLSDGGAGGSGSAVTVSVAVTTVLVPTEVVTEIVFVYLPFRVVVAVPVAGSELVDVDGGGKKSVAFCPSISTAVFLSRQFSFTPSDTPMGTAIQAVLACSQGYICQVPSSVQMPVPPATQATCLGLQAVSGVCLEYIRFRSLACWMFFRKVMASTVPVGGIEVATPVGISGLGVPVGWRVLVVLLRVMVDKVEFEICLVVLEEVIVVEVTLGNGSAVGLKLGRLVGMPDVGEVVVVEFSFVVVVGRGGGMMLPSLINEVTTRLDVADLGTLLVRFEMTEDGDELVARVADIELSLGIGEFTTLDPVKDEDVASPVDVDKPVDAPEVTAEPDAVSDAAGLFGGVNVRTVVVGEENTGGEKLKPLSVVVRDVDDSRGNAKLDLSVGAGMEIVDIDNPPVLDRVASEFPTLLLP